MTLCERCAPPKKPSRYVELYHEVSRWSHAHYFQGQYFNPEQWEKMWNEAFQYMVDQEEKARRWNDLYKDMTAVSICQALSNAAMAAEKHSKPLADYLWKNAEYWAKVCHSK